MKIEHLVIGGIYNWKRNSEERIIVRYLGCINNMYDFEYTNDIKFRSTTLSAEHVNTQISY